MSVSKFYILRSRFQPFTRHHYDAMISLIRNKRGEFERNEAAIVLAVIRDYETLLRIYDPDIELDISDVDFRHLPLFNPLSFNDIVLDIKEGNREYLSKEATDKQFLETILHHQLVIVPLYVKFSDLSKILQERKTTPPGLQSIHLIKNSKTSETNEASNTSERPEPLLRLLNNKVYDVLSISESPREGPSRIWCIPLFDLEDCSDGKKAQKIAKTDKYISILFNNIPSLRVSGLTVGELGVYGIFALYAIVEFQKTQEDGNLNIENIGVIEETIDAWAPEIVVQRFKARLATRVKEINNKFERNDKSSEKRYYVDEKRIELNFRSLMMAATHGDCQGVGGESISVGEASSIQHEFMTCLRQLIGKKVIINAAVTLTPPEKVKPVKDLLEIIEYVEQGSEPSWSISTDQLSAAEKLKKGDSDEYFSIEASNLRSVISEIRGKQWKHKGKS